LKAFDAFKPLFVAGAAIAKIPPAGKDSRTIISTNSRSGAKEGDDMDVRLRCRMALVLAAAVVIGTRVSTAPAAPPRPPVELLEDAGLADVFFLDPDRGWAVGDRGAIWRTDDGGRNWRLSDSPVGCRLHGICFLDGENGWAVGGWTHPYTHKTSGVVLRTLDGGQSWRQIPTAGLPMLRRIRMFDARSGWAIGAASPLYPPAAYRTEDGGRGWAPIAGDRPEGWLAGDFRDRNGGVIAGVGQVALAGTNRFQAAASPLTPGDTVRQVRLTEANAAWLVGDAGLVLHSPSGGAAWSVPPAWPRDVRRCFDFAALGTFGRHVWIAGSPGTRVFHSPDEGVTWEAFATDQPLPLTALFFLDENHGWAVGELGTILVTRDGGRSWLRQRGAATRLAVLGLLANPQSTPWELLVQLAGNEGHLCGAEYWNRGNSRSISESPATDRVHEAMLLVGGSTAHTANIGDHTSSEKALRQMEELFVRKIRQWRPEVLVTEPAGLAGEDPWRRLVNQAVVAAAAAAEDPARFPEHETLCGLVPWSPKKVYGVQPPDRPGSVSIIGASLAPRMGGTLADGAAAARSLLDAEFHDPPQTVELQLIADRASQGNARAGVMSGIVLPVGGEARRRLTEPSAGSLDLVAKNAQKQRNIQQIIARAAEQPSEAVIGQVDDLMRDLPEGPGGDVLFQLAERLRQQGRSDLAAEVYQRLVERFPRHDSSEAALVRLIAYWASSEAAAQAPRQAAFRRGVGEAVEPASFTAPANDVDHAIGPQPAVGASMQIRDAAVTSSAADQSRRDGQALALGQLAAKSFPALFAEPGIRFPLAAAARRQANPRQAERFIAPLATPELSHSWSQCARGELWLMKPVGDTPKQVARCLAASDKPYLDGGLDDAIWQDAALLEIVRTWPASTGEAPDAIAQLARDDDYLYFAVRCRKAPDTDYSQTAERRRYDAPLHGRDRIDLLIDLDRDYVTHYRLTVDHRGWTSDACVGNSSWNPEWFVAAASDLQTWTVEAAIPLRELTNQSIGRREVWAVGIERTFPGDDAPVQQAGTSPGRPDAFGWLLFE
jgi:photosystem II stability/assembly factor-like uncharacterized protein